MGSFWHFTAVCVALVWLFLPDFDCLQFAASHQPWLSGCVGLPGLEAATGVHTCAIHFEIYLPMRCGKYLCPCDHCTECDIYRNVFPDGRWDTLARGKASDGTGGFIASSIAERGTTMIELQNVTKVFREQIVLQNVHATFAPGLIHGVIGRNGAGKTVLLRLLCGLMRPTKGQVVADGKQLGQDMDFVPDAGIIIETPCFLPYLSGFQNLRELASIRNLISRGEIAAAMEKVGLDPASRKRVGRYSLGMRQRLGIAQAIMEHPRYLILDEPMNGLDTQGMEDMRKLLQKQKEAGVTVILASHSMEDIRLLCDTVYRIQDAALIACTTEFA